MENNCGCINPASKAIPLTSVEALGWVKQNWIGNLMTCMVFMGKKFANALLTTLAK